MKSSNVRQRGSVLIISLVLLIVLTMLGLSAMQNTSLEEHMVGNMRSENVAFQAAESGLRVGEAWLASRPAKPIPNSTGSNGVWLLDTPDPDASNTLPWWRERDAAWWASTATSISDDLPYTATDNLTEKPAYIIEERGVVTDTLNVGQQQDMIGLDYYQVTARGVDMGQRIEVFVRSTFARRY